MKIVIIKIEEWNIFVKIILICDRMYYGIKTIKCKSQY